MVSQVEKIFFAEHLSLMIKGGITINEALVALRDTTRSYSFKKTIDGVLEGVLRGESLSASLEKYPRVFNKFFCKVVKVGEESGTLEENLMYLAEQTRSFYQMKKKVIGALIYPAIVILMAIGIAFTVSLFILPKIVNVFRSLGVSPPLATRILMASSTFLQEYWWLVLLAVAGLVVAFKMLKRLKKGSVLFARIALSLPVLSTIIRNLNLARASRTLYTLIKSGVLVLEALDITTEILSNAAYRKKLLSMRPDVETGRKMSESLKQSPNLFPPSFAQMVAVGEKSGSLEESFAYLAEFYEREVDSALRTISGLIEPLLLVLVGIFVAFIAIAIIIPIYRFVGQFRVH